ncbi:hypothetical protein RFI_27736 [Reticulomyxa filosa]|uniref:Uncharacterized protein n=1 Tax=Reticulomyxa filosa TaxID=46433 RepID=X6M6U2_RETFI|nr:hypothetical protein RFI_27736 [Reticulomyxa filosa]|eukprot:ETO09639.1 hypothetical protein RFI_27736 [Reticulomyxa filosa]
MLSYETWLFLHEQVIDNICKLILKLLDHERVKPKVLIVTGGFSNCPYIVPRLEKLFSERKDPLKVYRPHNAHESVVRGSVLWAINQKKLSFLRAFSTLGLSVDWTWNPWDPHDDHKVSSFESSTGFLRKRCFDTIIRRDDKYEDGKEYDDVYVLPRQQTSVEFGLYKSEHKDGIQYCDDKSKCQLLKKFVIFFEKPLSKQVDFQITFILKHDRVRLLYKHPDTGNFDFAIVKFEGECVEDVVKIGKEFENEELKEDA